MKKINIESVYLRNEDLGGTEWIDKETSPALLKRLNLELQVQDLAAKKCDSDEVFAYITLVKETFDDGTTEFSISLLAIDKELDEADLMRIQGMGLDMLCATKDFRQPQFREGFCSQPLFLGEPEESFLLSLFEYHRRHRVQEVLKSLLTKEERMKCLSEVDRWHEEILEETREKAQALIN